ncbi:NAD(P)-binding protein [Hypoxylon sp. FL1857]|nr:NAD(P)-binding protein [Hypoxylon sp. FL1857]
MPSSHPLSAAALFSLEGYVAVVTGGGTGVGLVIAQTLAANGAKVYITGRRADVLETSARIHGSPERLGPEGGSIVAIDMDVTSKDSIKSAVAKITQMEDFVNVLVNNAGIWGGRPTAQPEDGPEAFSEAMMAEDKESNWQKSFDVNVTSQYFVTAAFLPLLAKAVSGPTGKIGTVINNSSVAAFLRVTQNRQFSYNASKAALTHLTRQMAYELSHEKINIRVNGLALGNYPAPFFPSMYPYSHVPNNSKRELLRVGTSMIYNPNNVDSIGYFPSEMTTGPSNDENVSVAPPNEHFAKFMESLGTKIVKRMGTPEEIASVILMLVTNEFIWGTTIIVDGGLVLTVPGNL